jgi:hypothetical protein
VNLCPEAFGIDCSIDGNALPGSEAMLLGGQPEGILTHGMSKSETACRFVASFDVRSRITF